MEDHGRVALIEALGGSLAGVLTELIFYGLDSYKVVKQANGELSFAKLFRGAVPIAIAGSGTSFAVFFGVYTPLKYKLDDFFGTENSSHAVLISSLVSAAPSSLVAVPADVVKKRVVLGQSPTLSSAFSDVYRSFGARGFFLGWKANMLKDIPFSAIKMTLYEGLARLYIHFADHHSDKSLKSEKLTPLESSLIGLGSGALTAVLTNPIDCVNTRIKSGELGNAGIIDAHLIIMKKDGPSALFRGLGPRTIILGLGSTVFWFWFGKLRGVLNEAL